MSKKQAIIIANIIKKTEACEQMLLVKHNKNLYKSLKNYLKYKQKIAKYNIKE